MSELEHVLLLYFSCFLMLFYYLKHYMHVLCGLIFTVRHYA